MRASIANKSPLDVHVISQNAPTGRSITYPNQPMSLLVQTDEGGGTKFLKPLPAIAFSPPLPQVLKPHTTWTGTFAGSDAVTRGTLFYAGFGQFEIASPVPGARPISMSTAKSATVP